jgi:hypothetical protein
MAAPSQGFALPSRHFVIEMPAGTARDLLHAKLRALRKATCPTGGRSGIRAEQAILGA